MEKENKGPKVFTFTLKNGFKDFNFDIKSDIESIDKYLKDIKSLDKEEKEIKERNERILKAMWICKTYCMDIEDYLITHGLVRVIGYKPPKPFSKEAATKSMLGRIKECESKIKKLESKVLDLRSENTSLRRSYDDIVREFDKYKKVIREHFVVRWLFNKYMYKS